MTLDQIEAQLAAQRAAIELIIHLFRKGGGATEGVVYFGADQIRAIERALHEADTAMGGAK